MSYNGLSSSADLEWLASGISPTMAAAMERNRLFVEEQRRLQQIREASAALAAQQAQQAQVQQATVVVPGSTPQQQQGSSSINYNQVQQQINAQRTADGHRTMINGERAQAGLPPAQFAAGVNIFEYLPQGSVGSQELAALQQQYQQQQANQGGYTQQGGGQQYFVPIGPGGQGNTYLQEGGSYEEEGLTLTEQFQESPGKFILGGLVALGLLGGAYYAVSGRKR